MTDQAGNYKYKHQKVKMSEVIPIDTPFTIVIEPTNSCNFKCSFCFHSLDKSKLSDKGFRSNHLNMTQFKKIIDDIKSFPEKIKVLRFSGFGEPFLNKKLPQMIQYAKVSNVAERIMVISNGSLLTEQLSDDLVKAGLDELLISVEGLSDEKYRVLCKADVNFDTFVRNIKSFYDNKGKSKIFTRILDSDMSENDHHFFDKTFGPITDGIFVDRVIPLFSGVDYSDLINDDSKDIEGNPKKALEICIQPFNSMFVHASGNVSACCTDYLEKIIFGNVFDESLMGIWNGKKLFNFRIMQLKKNRKKSIPCRECDYMDYVNQEENILDEKAEEILARMKKEAKIS